MPDPSLPLLFISAFGAATLLPLQSEGVLVALMLAGRHPAWMLLAVATLANVLGSVVNALIGRTLVQWQHRRWFPASPAQLAAAQQRYQRFGYWSLLASWVPIIGDPLTVIAGVMREPWWRFTLLVFIAKAGRYLVLAKLVPGGL